MDAEKTFFKEIVKEYMVPDRLPLIAINTFLAGYFFWQNGVAVFTYKAVGNNKKIFAQAYSHLALRASNVAWLVLTALVLLFFQQILTLLKVPPENS